MRNGVRFAIGAAVALIIVGMLWVGIGRQTQSPGAPEKIDRVAAANPPAPIEHAPAPPLADVQKASQTPEGGLAQHSKSTQVSQLLAAGTPEGAFKSWSILANCNDNRRLEHEARANVQSGPPEWLAERAKALASGELASATREACQDLSPTQIAERLKHLEKAAQAGVPHAAFGLMREGPWGDPSAMHFRWKDPAVQAWVARILDYLKVAAAKSDLDALDALIQQYQYGGALVEQPDPSAALRYATAHSLAYKRHYGRDVSPNRQKTRDSLVAGLPADEVQKERAAGVKLLGGKS